MHSRVRLAYVVLATAALGATIAEAVTNHGTNALLASVLFVLVVANAVKGERGARRRGRPENREESDH